MCFSPLAQYRLAPPPPARAPWPFAPLLPPSWSGPPPSSGSRAGTRPQLNHAKRPWCYRMNAISFRTWGFVLNFNLLFEFITQFHDGPENNHLNMPRWCEQLCPLFFCFCKWGCLYSFTSYCMKKNNRNSTCHFFLDCHFFFFCHSFFFLHSVILIRFSLYLIKQNSFGSDGFEQPCLGSGTVQLYTRCPLAESASCY